MRPLVITPPGSFTQYLNQPRKFRTHFLGGSIEMDKAERWQDRLITAWPDMPTEPDMWQDVVLNPRRAAWDSSWVQSIDNPEFTGQVQWELSAVYTADALLFYFDPNTMAPITLMELGIAAADQGRPRESVHVICPKGYWRKGNVDVVCKAHRIEKTYESLDQFIEMLQEAYR